jgi:hypothetical protein
MTRDKAEFLSEAVVIAVGIFALFLAHSIETYQEVSQIGPRLVPMVIAGLGIGLGVLQFSVSWIRRVKNGNTGNYTFSGTGHGKQPALSKTVILRMAAIIAIGFAYIWLFSATGYLIATAIAMVSLLLMFGTYNPGKVAMLTIVGTATYYIFFIWLMGIYNPPGWLINLEMLGL